MKLLILGGTVFLGRAVVEAATSRGHEVVLFNRGQSHPELFPEIEQIRGDRDGDLSALAGRRFDACLDTSGYVPRIVRKSAQQLQDSIGYYAFVSSLSVYINPSPDGTSEEAPLATLEDPTLEEVTGETYGPLKALCEAEVATALGGDRSLLVRPGLIVGPQDPTDRFTYWPWRVSLGSDILAPGRPERGIQFIDVRDLAFWIVGLLESKRAGVYNAVSPPGTFTMGDLLQTCLDVSESRGKLVWIEDAFLTQHEVGAWIELPLWIPEGDPIGQAFFKFRSDRALADGLLLRPIEETVRDTMNWAQSRPDDHAWRAGLARDRERELLTAWLRRS